VNGGVDFTQLGVAGIVAVLLLGALAVVWGKYQGALEQNRADQAQILPALIAASSAMTEVTRLANRLEDRERDYPRDALDGRLRDRDRRGN
jgi:hypothetical protein